MTSNLADGRWALEGPPPVEYRFLGLDRRLIWPTLGILLVQLFLAGVLPAINQSIDSEEFAPGTVLELSKGNGDVTFVPADGWSPNEAPLPGKPSLTIFRDGVTFAISTGEFDGTPSQLMDELVNEYEGDFKVTGEPQSFTLADGLQGAGVTITTEENTGMVVGLVSDVTAGVANSEGGGRKLAVMVRVESPEGQDISGYLEDVAGMLASLRVTQSGGGA